MPEAVIQLCVAFSLPALIFVEILLSTRVSSSNLRLRLGEGGVLSSHGGLDESVLSEISA